LFHFIQESLKTYFNNWIRINPLFILVFVWFIIQFIKITIDSIKNKKIDFHNLFLAWWFPSFHAGIVTSITTMVWIHFGFDSMFFALSCWFSLLVAYDSMNVRFESWKQAKYINEIRSNITSVLSMTKKDHPLLKERLWHTPIEVLGWIVFGFILTFVLYYYLILS
jgi:uncharacterized protein